MMIVKKIEHVLIVLKQLIMVDLNIFSLSLSFLLFDILVEYLWTYMRNNQKPRSSVLRKKSGKFFSVRIERIFMINVHWMLMME